MKSNSGTRIVCLLSLVGVIFSAMLLYHHVTVNSGFQTERSFCSISPGFDCDAVARSPFAELLNIPIASFAAFFYLALYVFAKAVELYQVRDSAKIRQVLSLAGVVALVPSVAFLSISLLVLKTVCLMCSVLYLVGFLLFVVTHVHRDKSESWGRNVTKGFGVVLRFFFRPSSLHPSLIPIARLSLLLALSTWFMVLFAPSWIQKEVLFPEADSKNREKIVTETVAAWKQSATNEIVVNRSSDLQARDFVRGADSAAYVLTIFSDFECPYCRRVAHELHAFPPDVLSKLRIVFKNYPLDSSCNRLIGRPMHPFACKAALYARCAGAQGEEKFWQMHDALFSLPEFTGDAIDALPQILGLEQSAFASCLASEQPLTKVHEDIDLGEKVNVEGTPALYLNGRPLLRATPEVFRKIFSENQ